MFLKIYFSDFVKGLGEGVRFVEAVVVVVVTIIQTVERIFNFGRGDVLKVTIMKKKYGGECGRRRKRSRRMRSDPRKRNSRTSCRCCCGCCRRCGRWRWVFFLFLLFISLPSRWQS